MKIGFFTDTYLPVTHGVVISIRTFKAVLEKMGHQVYIFAPHAPGYKDKEPNIIRFKSVKIVREPEIRFALPTFPQESFKEASKIKLDIIHVHTPFSMGLLAKYISRKQHIPIIYTHHTHYPEYAKVYFKEKYVLPQFAKVYSGWFGSMMDAMIAPSLKIKKLVRTYKVKKTVPIHVILTGIDLNKFVPSKSAKIAMRKKLKIPTKSKILLFVGRISKEKNVEFLIEAVQELKKTRTDFKLIMVGDGALRKTLIKKVDQLKLNDYVNLLGLVPYAEMPEYYKAADIFLFPSLTDTQGIVLLEAMGCGAPVVTLKDDAFAGVVIDEKNGYVVAKQSPKIYAHKIAQLLDDKKTYDKFSDEAIATAHKFSREIETEKLIGIYQDLIDKK